jgi:hypothetical protein
MHVSAVQSGLAPDIWVAQSKIWDYADLGHLRAIHPR